MVCAGDEGDREEGVLGIDCVLTDVIFPEEHVTVSECRSAPEYVLVPSCGST